MEKVGEFPVFQAPCAPRSKRKARCHCDARFGPSANSAASHGIVEILHCRALHRRAYRATRGLSGVSVWQVFTWPLLLCLAAVMCGSAQTVSTVPTADTVLARMAQARDQNRARFRPFIVTRNYTLFGKERHKRKSQVSAAVTFVPPDSKTYAIQQTTGIGIGETVVRRMLDSEAEVAKDYRSTDISADNYDFRLVGEENAGDRRCYVLELLPRRMDKNLLRGKIWVDADSYLVRRIQGQPAKKSLSWWLRDVRIELLYGEVGGMWLQTASEATANVRLLGRYTIISRDVKYDFGRLIVARAGLLSRRVPDGSLR